MSETTGPSSRAIAVTVMVAALGYFVDIYDLLLFTIVRVKSLTELGVTGPHSLDTGLELLSIQMWGLLAGGIAWGVLGDKKGGNTARQLIAEPHLLHCCEAFTALPHRYVHVTRNPFDNIATIAKRSEMPPSYFGAKCG